MLKQAAVVLLCAGLVGCGTESETPKLSEEYTGYVKRVVPVSEMQARSKDGKVVIDLRDTTDGYWVSPEVQHQGVDVICPSEQLMNMGAWLPEITSEFAARNVSLENGFIMFSSMKGTGDTQKPPLCNSPCYLHQEPDRTWVCFCPGA